VKLDAGPAVAAARQSIAHPSVATRAADAHLERGYRAPVVGGVRVQAGWRVTVRQQLVLLYVSSPQITPQVDGHLVPPLRERPLGAAAGQLRGSWVGYGGLGPPR